MRLESSYLDKWSDDKQETNHSWDNHPIRLLQPTRKNQEPAVYRTVRGGVRGQDFHLEIHPTQSFVSFLNILINYEQINFFIGKKNYYLL